jgi:hypothetical protein
MVDQESVTSEDDRGIDSLAAADRRDEVAD